jgi:hypothetical protein
MCALKLNNIPILDAVTMVVGPSSKEHGDRVKEARDKFVKETPGGGLLVGAIENAGYAAGLIVGVGGAVAFKAPKIVNRKVGNQIRRIDQALINRDFKGNPRKDVTLWGGGGGISFFTNNKMGYASAFTLHFSDFGPNPRENTDLYNTYQAQITNAPDPYAELGNLARQWLLEQIRVNLGDAKEFDNLVKALGDAGSPAQVRFNLILRGVIDRFLRIFDLYGGGNYFYPRPIYTRTQAALARNDRRWMNHGVDALVRHRNAGQPLFPVTVPLSVNALGEESGVTVEQANWVDRDGQQPTVEEMRAAIGLMPDGRARHVDPAVAGAAVSPVAYFRDNLEANLVQDLLENNPDYLRANGDYKFVMLQEFIQVLYRMFLEMVDPNGILRPENDKSVLGEIQQGELMNKKQLISRVERGDLKAPKFPGSALMPKPARDAAEDLWKRSDKVKNTDGITLEQSYVLLDINPAETFQQLVGGRGFGATSIEDIIDKVSGKINDAYDKMTRLETAVAALPNPPRDEAQRTFGDYKKKFSVAVNTVLNKLVTETAQAQKRNAEPAKERAERNLIGARQRLQIAQQQLATNPATPRGQEKINSAQAEIEQEQARIAIANQAIQAANEADAGFRNQLAGAQRNAPEADMPGWLRDPLYQSEGAGWPEYTAAIERLLEGLQQPRLNDVVYKVAGMRGALQARVDAANAAEQQAQQAREQQAAQQQEQQRVERENQMRTELQNNIIRFGDMLEAYYTNGTFTELETLAKQLNAAVASFNTTPQGQQLNAYMEQVAVRGEVQQRLNSLNAVIDFNAVLTDLQNAQTAIEQLGQNNPTLIQQGGSLENLYRAALDQIANLRTELTERRNAIAPIIQTAQGMLGQPLPPMPFDQSNQRNRPNNRRP